MFRIPALGIGAAVALFVSTGLSARRSTASPRQPLQEPRFRTGVDLVRLSVTARDERGTIVHDLQPRDFQVFEDGVEQKVEHFGQHESPISVVVLFDKSGSMAGDKLMHAKDAVINFAAALQPQDEVLVMAFSDGVDQLGRFGLDRKTIEREVSAIRVENATRLYDAVIAGANTITTPDRKEKRAILILSDGEDTASREGLDQAIEAVKRAEVPVYAIGIEMEDNARRTPDPRSIWTRQTDPRPLETLKRLTDGTGGWTYPIVAAKRCKEICLRVANELRSQYLLGYYSANSAHDGHWRTVTVRTARPGLTLTTRTGYYAPRSLPTLA